MVGILKYNELKREADKASLLLVSGMLPGAEQLNRFQLAKQFKSFTGLNTRTHTNAVHISLNFSPQDQLDEEKMKVLAQEYVDRIGFGKQPYLVYRHFDAGHPHVHIVTTNIDRRGKRIETHNLGRGKSEEARKILEIRHGLIPAKNHEYIGPDLKSLLKYGYGVLPTKAGLSSVINHVLANYSFASLTEFNAVLGLFQVTAYRGEKDSLLYQNRGLVFNFLDAQGYRLGVPLKASSFYAKPTLDRLERRFGRAVVRKIEMKAEIATRVEKILGKQQGKDSKPIDAFAKDLLQKGIALRLVYNDSGRLYGVTYIDHRSGCVYKGSELGKGFTSNGLAKRFALLVEPKPALKVSNPLSANKEQQGGIKEQDRGSDFHILELLPDVGKTNVGAVSDIPYRGPVYPKKKRKKRRDISAKDST